MSGVSLGDHRSEDEEETKRDVNRALTQTERVGYEQTNLDMEEVEDEDSVYSAPSQEMGIHRINQNDENFKAREKSPP